MLVQVSKRLYRDGESTRLGLPKVWTNSLGLSPGDEVELVFNEIGLLVIPKRSSGSERIVRAMREGS